MASPPVYQLLTNCAACAAPLAQDHKARCVRCQTRYCHATCHDALDTEREIWGLRSHLGPNYSRHLGRTAQEIFEAALDYATALISKNHFHEAKNLLCEAVNASEEQLGRYHVTTIEIKHGYAQALWGYHFYGHDGYRDDLRKSIEMLEKLWTLPDEIRPPHVKSTLIRARNEQLDWCVDDLPPPKICRFRCLCCGAKLVAATDFQVHCAKMQQCRDFGFRCEKIYEMAS